MSDNDDRGYTLTRLFAAPRELVWQCWTQAEHFSVWFGGHEAVLQDMVVDARPGGRWSGTMVDHGNRIAWSGTFLEVEPPSRLVLAFTDKPELGDEYDVITATFSDLGGKTELILRQTGGHLTDEQYAQAQAGTATFLDVMAELLATLQ
jgi:uncharacterized protein YndB with AHSA1/START domain